MHDLYQHKIALCQCHPVSSLSSPKCVLHETSFTFIILTAATEDDSEDLISDSVSSLWIGACLDCNQIMSQDAPQLVIHDICDYNLPTNSTEHTHKDMNMCKLSQTHRSS